jgi:hypothetical protein
MGCRKKTAPQFYELESKYSVSLARDGDDAYATPEMDQLVTGLSAIGEDTVEGPKAKQLVETIERERERLRREKDEAQRAIQPTVVPTLPPEPVKNPGAGAGVPEAAVDAGKPSEPYGNMPLAEFRALFGACMVEVGSVDLTGKPGKGLGFTTQDSAQCKSQLHQDDATKVTYVFADERLTERKIERTVQTIIDAGRPAPVPEANKADAVPYVPGMPTPAQGPSEGTQK